MGEKRIKMWLVIIVAAFITHKHELVTFWSHVPLVRQTFFYR